MTAGRGSAHMGRMMNLRSELVAMLEEFEHFAYDGAPLSTATEKVREILDKTAPKVLTTVEELDSEEAAKALCLVTEDGSRIYGFYSRRDGQNEWTATGSAEFFTSSELLADYANKMDAVRFVLVAKEPENLVPAGPKVLTTLEELNSEEAFTALCIMPYGGPLRTPSARAYGVNYWQEPGVEGEYSTAELLAHFANIGAAPAFTLIKG
jgi:hypothetical protein